MRLAAKAARTRAAAANVSLLRWRKTSERGARPSSPPQSKTRIVFFVVVVVASRDRALQIRKGLATGGRERARASDRAAGGGLTFLLLLLVVKRARRFHLRVASFIAHVVFWFRQLVRRFCAGAAIFAQSH